MDPFEAGLANRLLVARHNGKRVMIPSIPKALMRHAHASCRATFRFDDGTRLIEGRVDYREKQRATAIEARGSEVMTVSRTTPGNVGQNGATRRTRRRRSVEMRWSSSVVLISKSTGTTGGSSTALRG